MANGLSSGPEKLKAAQALIEFASQLPPGWVKIYSSRLSGYFYLLLYIGEEVFIKLVKIRHFLG